MKIKHVVPKGEFCVVSTCFLPKSLVIWPIYQFDLWDPYGGPLIAVISTLL